MRKPWDCPICGDCFLSPRAVRDHSRDRHKKNVEPRRRPKPAQVPEHEMSYAERDIAAREAVSEGEFTVDYWLIEGSIE